MTTPKRRDREQRQFRDKASVATLSLNCRTARMLLNDVKGRVQDLILLPDATQVGVVLAHGWEFDGGYQTRHFLTLTPSRGGGGYDTLLDGSGFRTARDSRTSFLGRHWANRRQCDGAQGGSAHVSRRVEWQAAVVKGTGK